MASKDPGIGSVYRRQTYVLGAAEGDTGDTGNTGEVQLLESLASLLLVAGVDDGRRTGGEVALASIDLGVTAAVVLNVLDVGLGDLVIGELFDSGVGHFDGWGK